MGSRGGDSAAVMETLLRGQPGTLVFFFCVCVFFGEVACRVFFALFCFLFILFLVAALFGLFVSFFVSELF